MVLSCVEQGDGRSREMLDAERHRASPGLRHPFRVGDRVWASGFMQLREITGKRMILTRLSNHTLGVIITVHDISHLGVKITSL